MELQWIDYLRRRLPGHPCLAVGPGDDAAVFRSADGPSVVTVDMLMDGVDFCLEKTDPRRVGRKALAVNLSDLAAMASRPLAAVIALALPRRGGMTLAHELYEGLIPLAERYEVALAGGDTNTWDGPLVISITALGLQTPRGPLRRAGARPGDCIVVTGALGGSILGRHLDFEPRVLESLLLNEKYPLHAGIDVSDGLSLDLSRLCQESGCGAVLDLDRVPVSQAAHELAAKTGDGQSALDHALADGEDFELILAVPAEAADRMILDQPLDVPLTIIGRFVAEQGVWQDDPRSGRRPLLPKGYQHEMD